MQTTRQASSTSTRRTTQNRLAAMALSALMTLGMLAGVNQLAVSDAPASLVAQMGQSRG